MCSLSVFAIARRRTVPCTVSLACVPAFPLNADPPPRVVLRLLAPTRFAAHCGHCVSHCRCLLGRSLIKFQPWSMYQGWKIKKGPFSNTHNLLRSDRSFLVCARLPPPGRRTTVPTNCRPFTLTLCLVLRHVTKHFASAMPLGHAEQIIVDKT